MLIVLSLTGVVWIALALRELSVVTGDGQSGMVLFKMTTLALPNLMAIVAPFALLIAVIHTLNRLNGDSELIVLAASGATIWTVGRPLLLLAGVVMTAVFFVNHIAMPWSLRHLRELILEVRTDLLTQVIQPGKFSSPEQGLTFHIRDRSASGELIGVLMNDARKPPEMRSYLAERALVVKQGDDAYVIMSDGHIVQRNEAGDPAEIIAFQKYAIDLNQFEKKEEEKSDFKPRERYFSELVAPEPGSRNFKDNPGQFRSELHERFANPLYPIAFVFIALAAVGQAQSTRQGRTQRMVGGFLIATTSRVAGLAVNNMAVLNPLALIGLYGIPVLASLGALFVIRSSARPISRFSVLDMISDRMGPMARRLNDGAAALGQMFGRRRGHK